LSKFPAYRGFVAFDAAAFGHRVRSARVWVGLAPKELAAMLGRSDEAIYRIERGEYRGKPDKLLLQALARELGQTEEWLLSGEAPPWEAERASASRDLADRARPVAERLAEDLEELIRLLGEDDQREAASG
jgi:transcriptional regulator with XRE-family HTH domain